ncbi:MAG: WbqC family protein [Planctomycetaceae bacterium]|nr:WbqC family protein [Planctomycetaceae bacterium]
MIAAAHQPNFFPWMGYFRKIARSEVFVFLDAVPFGSKGTWINRVKMMVSGAAQWVICPVASAHEKRICEITIVEPSPWRKKLIKTLEMNYGKAACFKEVMPWIEPMILRQEENLSRYNIQNILEICQRLGLHRRFVLHSELPPGEPHELLGSERLAAICSQLGAGVYLAGDGADDYEQQTAYDRKGLRLERLGFVPQPYPQAGAAGFVAGLSVLDCLFNVGVEATASMLTHDPGAPQ